jgi:AcrR family transcriptional regulator
MPVAPRTARRRGRPPLTPAGIVQVALDLAAERGDFSMRALGQKLGADPMAVYRHFADKNALLDAMLDAALADFQPPGPDAADPLAGLRRMSHDFRAALLRHPGMAERVAMNRPATGPHTLELAEATLGKLFRLGLEASDAITGFEALVQFISGFVRAEEPVHARDDGGESAWLAEMQAAYSAVPADRFPHVARMAAQMPEQTLDRQFEYAIDLLLESLARRARK